MHNVLSLPRIILQPSFSGDEQYCYLDGNCSTFDFGSVPAASTEVFEHNINDQFVDLNTGNASIHSFLDEEAKRFICSGKFIIPFCPEQTSQPLQGFQTQIEKGYVVLFVFFAACSVVLGIFLLSICYEDRVMKAEMKRSSIDSRERPLSTLSMQSNDE